MPVSALNLISASEDVASETAKVLAEIVRLIVAIPDSVHIRIQANTGVVTLLLTVDPDDIGKIIGKQGRTVRSLRVILSTISSKSGVRFELDVRGERT